MAQFKTTLVLFIAALFIASSSAASPCKPGYVQVEDCVEKAIDPADGNCWWGYDTGSCGEIYATSVAQCGAYCTDCHNCIYNYGCCYEGDTTLIQFCIDRCVSFL